MAEYTRLLQLALPAVGEYPSAWGPVVNDEITQLIEDAVAGLLVLSDWDAATQTITLTSAEQASSSSRRAILEFTDTDPPILTGAGTVTCLNLSKIYIVKNTTGQNITFKTVAGSGILIPNGNTTLLYCDGTNVFSAISNIPTLQLGSSDVIVNAISDNEDLPLEPSTLSTSRAIRTYIDTLDKPTLESVLLVGDITGDNQNIVLSTGSAIQSAAGTNLNITPPNNANVIINGLANAIGGRLDLLGNPATADVTGHTLQLQASVSTGSVINAVNLNDDIPPVLHLQTDDTTAVTIDDNQNVLLGSDATVGISGIDTANLQVVGAGASSDSSVNIANFSASSFGSNLNFGKSRSDTIGTMTAVQTGDSLGTLNFAGSDGVDIESTGVRIKAVVDGNVTSNSVPGAVTFDTTEVGASDPVERLRIKNNGEITAGGSVVVGNTAAIAVTGTDAAKLQVIGGNNESALNLTNFSVGTEGANLNFGKSRSDTVGVILPVTDGDSLGTLNFAGADGTNLEPIGARITTTVDGDVATDSVPGAIAFETTAATENTPVERLRITNEGLTLPSDSQIQSIGDINLTSSTGNIGLTSSTGNIELTPAADSKVVVATGTNFQLGDTTAVNNISDSNTLPSADATTLSTSRATKNYVDNTHSSLTQVLGKGSDTGTDQNINLSSGSSLTSVGNINLTPLAGANVVVATGTNLQLGSTTAVNNISDSNTLPSADATTLSTSRATKNYVDNTHSSLTQVLGKGSDTGTDQNINLSSGSSITSVGNIELTPLAGSKVVVATGTDFQLGSTAVVNAVSDSSALPESNTTTLSTSRAIKSYVDSHHYSLERTLDVGNDTGPDKQIIFSSGSSIQTAADTNLNIIPSNNSRTVIDGLGNDIGAKLDLIGDPTQAEDVGYNLEFQASAATGAVINTVHNIDQPYPTFRLKMNNSTALTVDSFRYALFQVPNSFTVAGFPSTVQVSAPPNVGGLNLSAYGSTVNQGPKINFGKSRADSAVTPTIVQYGDELGVLNFAGANGSNYNTIGARISSTVDDTPSTTNVSGNLTFATTSSDTATNFPEQRLQIRGNGAIIHGDESLGGLAEHSFTRTLSTGYNLVTLWLFGSVSTQGTFSAEVDVTIDFNDTASLRSKLMFLVNRYGNEPAEFRSNAQNVHQYNIGTVVPTAGFLPYVTSRDNLTYLYVSFATSVPTTSICYASVRYSGVSSETLFVCPQDPFEEI